jgi:hypothetical protein
LTLTDSVIDADEAQCDKHNASNANQSMRQDGMWVMSGINSRVAGEMHAGVAAWLGTRMKR